MKIHHFSYIDQDKESWQLSPIEFDEHINLFVGASGSGKTRVLNMLFNIATFVTSDSRFCSGNWEMKYEHAGRNYFWKYAGEKTNDKTFVLSETLSVLEAGVETLIFSRDKSNIIFEGAPTPKLSPSSSAIFLLKEEDSIRPAHEAFSKILRRSFSDDELANVKQYQSIPRHLVKKMESSPDLKTLFTSGLRLSTYLYFVERFYKSKFEQICEQFKRVFPFIEDITISTLSEIHHELDAPVAFFKETGVKKPIAVHDLSSGMQKVLLIITDVITSPDEFLYLMDEYENSLGINAIDFLVPFINECGAERQFILTSHHPSLINAIPVEDWFVFHRKGSRIQVKFGRELIEKYGKSRQQKFIQLINDPFYVEGNE